MWVYDYTSFEIWIFFFNSYYSLQIIFFKSSRGFFKVNGKNNVEVDFFSSLYFRIASFVFSGKKPHKIKKLTWDHKHFYSIFNLKRAVSFLLVDESLLKTQMKIGRYNKVCCALTLRYLGLWNKRFLWLQELILHASLNVNITGKNSL